MLKIIDHIGVAVQSEENATSLFSRLFGFPPQKKETVVHEGVTTIFYYLGDTKIELLVPDTLDGNIQKYINKRGEGIHHIAFLVEDINTEVKRLVSEGFRSIGEIRSGADNKLIIFFHPKDTNGVLIELCQHK